jgi:hypothetical protein
MAKTHGIMGEAFLLLPPEMERVGICYICITTTDGQRILHGHGVHISVSICYGLYKDVYGTRSTVLITFGRLYILPTL